MPLGMLLSVQKRRAILKFDREIIATLGILKNARSILRSGVSFNMFLASHGRS